MIAQVALHTVKNAKCNHCDAEAAAPKHPSPLKYRSPYEWKAEIKMVRVVTVVVNL